MYFPLHEGHAHSSSAVSFEVILTAAVVLGLSALLSYWLKVRA